MKGNKKRITIPKAVVTVALAFAAVWLILGLNAQRLNAKLAESQGEDILEETTVELTEDATVPDLDTITSNVVVSADNYSEKDIPVNSKLIIVALHANSEYSLNYSSGQYKAAYFTSTLKDDGRDVTLVINTDIDSISVATSFITETGELCEFGKFENLKFKTDKGVTTVEYSIPDNPFGISYGSKPFGCCAVFRINIGEQTVYTSISY